ncbi:MAG: glycosyltransferase family 39 protein [Pseudomonadota bacterium]
MTLLQSLSSGWKAWGLLAALTFVAAVPGVAYIPALDRDESRFAQASKQMLETGNLIEIRYQDEGRNKKPAGIHWMQAGATGMMSEAGAGAIWSYRLPSLIGAVAATLLTFWCGIVLVGRRAAFVGAALFGSGLLLTSEAHIAKTDAVLVALTVLAMGALARLYMGKSQAEVAQRNLVYLFWIALGVSFLIKGPVSMLVAGLAVVALSAVRRDWHWWRGLLNGPALAAFVVIVLPWFLWVQIATGGAYLEGAVGKDLTDKLVSASEGHGGWPGYHVLFSLTHFFPATLVLIPALVLLVQALQRRRLDMLAGETKGLWFLAAWAGPTWIFFEFLPTKLSHYILPAYPALALICGWACLKLMSGVRLPVSRAASLAMFLLGASVLALVTSPWGVSAIQLEAAGDFRRAADSAAVLAQWLSYSSMPTAFLWIGALAAIATAITWVIRAYGAALALAITTCVLLGWHVRVAALPGAIWAQPTTTAHLALAEVCGLANRALEECAGVAAPSHVAAVGYAEPSFVFTTGTETLIPPNTVVALPDDPAAFPSVWLFNIEDAVGAEAYQALARTAEAAGHCVSESDPYFALNYSNGDPVAFVALRIEDRPCA